MGRGRLGRASAAWRTTAVAGVLTALSLPGAALASGGGTTVTTTVTGPNGAVTTTVTTSTVTSAAEPLLSFKGGPGKVATILLFVLVLSIIGIYLYDLYCSNNPWGKHRPVNPTKDQVDLATLRANGSSGLVRVLIALGLLMALVLVVAALVGSAASDAPDLRKTVITGLLASFTTVIGFYFGAKGTNAPPPTPPGPPTPVVPPVVPPVVVPPVAPQPPVIVPPVVE